MSRVKPWGPSAQNSCAAAISPDNTIIATVGLANNVGLFSVSEGRLLQRIPSDAQEQSIAELAFSPDGKILAIAAGNKCKLWNLEAQTSRELVGHQGAVKHLQFSRSGELLATLAEDATVRIWNLASGRSAHRLVGFRHTPHSADCSSDEKSIVVGTKYGDISLWDLPSGQELCRLAQYGEKLGDVSFHGPDEIWAVLLDNEKGGRIEVFSAFRNIVTQ